MVSTKGFRQLAELCEIQQNMIDKLHEAVKLNNEQIKSTVEMIKTLEHAIVTTNKRVLHVKSDFEELVNIVEKIDADLRV